MLKNKIIVKRIRNIFILLMAIIILIGIYTNIRRSLAEDVIEISMSVTDKTGVLSEHTVMLDATRTSSGKYQIELPTSVSGNIITKYYTAEGEGIPVQIDGDKVTLELDETEVDSKTVKLYSDYDQKSVIYNKDGVETTKTLYNKEWKYSDEMIVTGYMPLESELQVTPIDVATLTDVKLPNANQRMEKAFDVTIIETVQTIIETVQEPEEGTEVVEGMAPTVNTEVKTEKVEYNPSVYGEKTKVNIKFTPNEDEDISVYKLNDQNELTEIEKTVEEETISFETDEITKYLIASLPQFIAEQEKSDWKVIETNADIANGTSTLTVKGPNDNLTAEWIQVIVNGQEVTEGITKTVSEPERLEDGVQYTITVSGIAKDAYQVQFKLVEPVVEELVQIEQQQLQTNLLSTQSEEVDTVEEELTDTSSGAVLLAATTYNTLKSSSAEDDRIDGFLGNTKIERQFIESVTFMSSIANANSTKWDVSAAGDGSILAWYTGSNPYQVYIGSASTIYANANSSYLFSYIGFGGNSTATSPIVNLSLLNTSNVTNMQGMFYFTGYTKMTALNLGSFNTSNVTNMREMFAGCGYKAMTSLNLGTAFNTSKVTDMSYMFSETGYTAMTTLTLGSNFNTGAVTSMAWMFAHCGLLKLTSLNLGNNFDTSNVIDMHYMFWRCGQYAMTSLDLGDKFNTSKVTNMGQMFYHTGYAAMTSLDLGDKFYTNNVTDMNYMFSFCGYTSMTSLDLGPAFTNIVGGSQLFSDTGKSGCTIYVGESIYSDSTHVRLNASSTSTIEYTRGAIELKYQTKWVRTDATVDTATNVITMTLKTTTDPRVYTANTTSELTANDITILMNDEVASGITVSLGASSTVTNTSTGKTETTQIITITGASSLTGLKVRLAPRTSIDAYGNGNLLTYATVYNFLRKTNTETEATRGFLGNTNIQRQNIENITFLDTLENAPEVDGVTCWDVSEAQDYSILAWYSGTAPYTVYIASDGEIFANPDSSYLFSYTGYASTCTATEVITNIDLLNTSGATNMRQMFFWTGYNAMTTLNLGEKFDTSKVTNMRAMFYGTGYNAMTKLELGAKFNTSNVTTMQDMFRTVRIHRDEDFKFRY